MRLRLVQEVSGRGENLSQEAESSPPTSRGMHRGHALAISDVLPSHPGVDRFDESTSFCATNKSDLRSERASKSGGGFVPPYNPRGDAKPVEQLDTRHG
jgi:hypothetical protein